MQGASDQGEPLISLDVCKTLVGAGYQVDGPANTIAGALFRLQRQPPDLAIINIEFLDGHRAELARELRRCSVPFVIHSGFTPA